MNKRKRVTISLKKLWSFLMEGESESMNMAQTFCGMLRKDALCGSYDLFIGGELVCMDGDTVEIVNIDTSSSECCFILRNLDENTEFKLSANEYAACASGQKG